METVLVFVHEILVIKYTFLFMFTVESCGNKTSTVISIES